MAKKLDSRLLDGIYQIAEKLLKEEVSEWQGQLSRV
jgi:hypothetical protein